MTTSHPAYRPDIDGLRAIAVLAVIGFHAFPAKVPGGFIGVDVFFVISGFLISTVIFKALENGTFSYAEFYGRRIRRLFPALLVVLVSCLVFGWFGLLAHEYAALGKHVFAGTLFVSNIVLWFESGYFDVIAGLKPLLHLWSLGIEEQFYILWPLLLAAVWSRTPTRLRWISGLLLLSFALNIARVENDPVSTFFLPMTRLWELAIGALLAYAVLFHGSSGLPRWPSPLRRVLPDAGAALAIVVILGCSFALDEHASFPGWWALLPTLATAMLIAIGPASWINRRLLSHGSLVLIGLMAYPLYLWHWPLLSLLRILNFGEIPNSRIRVVAVLASTLLAYLTYRFVENPIRRSANRAVPLWLGAAAVPVALFGFSTYAFGGYPQRIDIPSSQHYRVNNFLARTVGQIEGVTNCSDRLEGQAPVECRSKGTPAVAILGDSHASSLFHGFATSEDPTFSNVMVFSKGSCVPLLSVESLPGCEAYVEAALGIIEKTPSVRFVLLTNYYSFDALKLRATGDEGATAEDALVRKGYAAIVRRLQSLGRQAILVKDNPALSFDPEACVSARPMTLSRARSVAECSVSREYFDGQRRDYNALVDRVHRDNPGLVVFDATPRFCDEARCSAFADGLLQYADFNHLSIHGSRRFAAFFIETARTHRWGVEPVAGQ